MQTPDFDKIVEPNDQTEARREHLESLRALVGNVYPNKFERSRLTGADDTITRLVNLDEIKKEVPALPEGERPSAGIKDAANEPYAFRKCSCRRPACNPASAHGQSRVRASERRLSRLQIYGRER